jgi:outer membrane protein assembly factor BamD
MNYRIKLFFAVTLLLLYGGCAKPEIDLSAAEYMAIGQEYMKDKTYRKAIPAFESAVLASNSPEEARLAQLSLADAYFLRAEGVWLWLSIEKEEHLQAIAAYETYYDLYPGDANERLVLYRLAHIYSALSFPPRNDQTFTKNAVSYLNELKRKYPGYIPERPYESVNTLLSRMNEKLAEHEYEVAKFYLRIDKPESAVQRLLYLMRNYPGTSFEPRALVMLAETAYEIPSLQASSKGYFDELVSRFPDNENISRLRKNYGW